MQVPNCNFPTETSNLFLSAFMLYNYIILVITRHLTILILFAIYVNLVSILFFYDFQYGDTEN